MSLNIGFFINNTFRYGNYASQGNAGRARGIAGMLVPTDNELKLCQKIIDVPEEHRQKLFDMVKQEFIKGNGVANADVTNRSSVYREYQISINKEDRLNGTWSMQQYEERYMKAFYGAVKASNPNWKPGQLFDTSVLEGITRKKVENILI